MLDFKMWVGLYSMWLHVVGGSRIKLGKIAESFALPIIIIAPSDSKASENRLYTAIFGASKK